MIGCWDASNTLPSQCVLYLFTGSSLEAACLPACQGSVKSWGCLRVSLPAERWMCWRWAARPKTARGPMRRCAEMQGARSPALQLLLLLPLICCVCAAAVYPFKTPSDLDVTPRVTVSSSGEHGRTRARSLPLAFSRQTKNEAEQSLRQTRLQSKALELRKKNLILELKKSNSYCCY